MDWDRFGHPGLARIKLYGNLVVDFDAVVLIIQQ